MIGGEGDNTDMGSTRGNRSLIWKSVLMIAAILGMNLAGTLSSPARAQGQGAYFPVFVLACDAYVKMKGSASGMGYPPECRGLGDITVSAYDTQGARLDACTTNADGVCHLAIDYNGTRIFREDTKNVPESYRPESALQRVFTYTEFAEIAFHNYREDVFPQRDAPRATVRVHTRICPDKYTGDAFFDDCDAGVPETNQWIIGSGDVYARAGKDGNAVLKYIAAGNNTEIIGGQGLETGDIFFYCSLTKDPSTRIPTSVEVTAQYDGVTRDFVGKLSLDPQSDVTCDWYQIPHLDRGLWDTAVNVMATKDSNATYEGGVGDIHLRAYFCADPKPGIDPATDCFGPDTNGTIRAATGDGTEIATATTDQKGQAAISVNDKAIDSFWISFDGHDSVAGDVVSCEAVTEAKDKIEQSTTFNDGKTAWTIPGLGDDLGGQSCTWLLKSTGP
jgi:hypothetical protein